MSAHRVRVVFENNILSTFDLPAGSTLSVLAGRLSILGERFNDLPIYIDIRPIALH